MRRLLAGSNFSFSSASCQSLLTETDHSRYKSLVGPMKGETLMDETMEKMPQHFVFIPHLPEHGPTPGAAQLIDPETQRLFCWKQEVLCRTLESRRSGQKEVILDENWNIRTSPAQVLRDINPGMKQEVVIIR